MTDSYSPSQLLIASSALAPSSHRGVRENSDREVTGMATRLFSAEDTTDLIFRNETDIFRQITKMSPVG